MNKVTKIMKDLFEGDSSKEATEFIKKNDSVFKMDLKGFTSVVKKFVKDNEAIYGTGTFKSNSVYDSGEGDSRDTWSSLNFSVEFINSDKVKTVFGIDCSTIERGSSNRRFGDSQDIYFKVNSTGMSFNDKLFKRATIIEKKAYIDFLKTGMPNIIRWSDSINKVKNQQGASNKNEVISYLLNFRYELTGSRSYTDWAEDVQVYQDKGKDMRFTYGVRDWGVWENPEGKEDEEDYDWQVLSPKYYTQASETFKKYMDKAPFKNEIDEAYVSPEEKNWLDFVVTFK